MRYNDDNANIFIENWHDKLDQSLYYRSISKSVRSVDWFLINISIVLIFSELISGVNKFKINYRSQVELISGSRSITNYRKKTFF